MRIHETLRVTQATQVGVTDRLWTIEDFAEMITRFSGAEDLSKTRPMGT